MNWSTPQPSFNRNAGQCPSFSCLFVWRRNVLYCCCVCCSCQTFGFSSGLQVTHLQAFFIA